MSKPWLETKLQKLAIGVLNECMGTFDGACGANEGNARGALKALLRAAPADAGPDMARALLRVEWGFSGKGPYGYCEACGTNCEHRHKDDCLVDAALAKAGLPDQASRDAARKELGI